jgi:glycosyltransferase involved in cell wall biosynthesis
MNVLYIDGVGPWGGASRSLTEMLQEIPEKDVKKYFLMARGTVEDKYKALANDYLVSPAITRFDNSFYSFYRGVRWLVLLREIAALPFTIYYVFKAFYRWRGQIDLLHSNEIMEIFPLLLAKWLFKVPAILHVRSLQNDEKRWRSRLINYLLLKSVDQIIAIDENVKGTLPAFLKVEVIHNSFLVNQKGEKDFLFREKLSKLPTDSLVVGYVGNLLLQKGIIELVEASRLLKECGHNVQFLIVGGETRGTKGLKEKIIGILGLQQNVGDQVERMITAYDLDDCFHLVGATFDIHAAYEVMDVIAFPSHLNAPGRPIFEAAFYGVPSIVAIRNPKSDTLEDTQTGFAINEKAHGDLAEKIESFLKNPQLVKSMGLRAKELAQKNFVPATNAKLLLDIYRRLYKSN